MRKAPFSRSLKMIHYSTWYQNNQSIFVKNFKGDKLYFCSLIEVTKRLRDISTGAHLLEIKFLVGNLSESIILDRRLLAGKFLPELVANGFSIVSTDVNEHTLAEIFIDQERCVPLDACHSKLGFQECKGKTYYFGNEELSGQLNSTYIGAQPISCEGSFCKWQNFVEEFLQENPLLALPLAMGVSAPVATRLKNAGSTDETALWALIGTTSTGKTTCLKLSASAWGKPSGDGIIDNLTGTEKYFFASLASREGYPGFYDEVSAVTWDFTKAIYTVALSREGGRCNPDGTPKKRKNWSGAVIFTGETSMFHRTNGNGGLHARLVEFDFRWFDNGEVPDKIGRFVSRNYGTAWMQYIPYLQSLDDLKLTSLFDDKVAEIKKKLALRAGFDEETWETKVFNGIQNRIIKKLALLLLSVDTMLEAWNLDLDREKVVEYILDTYDHNASRIDKIDEFRENFIQHIARHRDSFPEVVHSGFNLSAKISVRGFQDHYKQRNCVWVLASEFNEQLLNHGLDSSPNTLKELHSRGIIEHFGDRYKKIYRTGKIEPVCYCFYQDSANPAPPKPKNKKNKKKKMTKQLKSLLEE